MCSNIFDELFNIAQDVNCLTQFISNNHILENAFTKSYNNTKTNDIDSFERFVLLKANVIENLDFNDIQSRAFIYYLMDLCEKFNSISAAVRLYGIISRNQLNIGSRLEAAMLYLYNVPDNQIYVDRFEEICSKIQIAINEEEDNDLKAISTFLNYYSFVVYNTNPHTSFAIQIQEKYKELIKQSCYPFLNDERIKNWLLYSIVDAPKLFYDIQNYIIQLSTNVEVPLAKIYSDTDYLVETDTEYSRLLSKNTPQFHNIRQLAINMLKQYDNHDKIFYSLGRGVAILKEEEQLYSYIRNYGNMHVEKMRSALVNVPLYEITNSEVEIFDWACGQGLATIVLSEYCNNNEINLNPSFITLIEPSEIAIKRASLHVKHFFRNSSIKTITKEIDSLIVSDIVSNKNNVKIHLFSNILDYSGFSLQYLITLINKTFCGENYFICVSPYITDASTARIEMFYQEFMNISNSISYCKIDNHKGEWMNNWSRCVRSFKVQLSD